MIHANKVVQWLLLEVRGFVNGVWSLTVETKQTVLYQKHIFSVTISFGVCFFHEEIKPRDAPCSLSQISLSHTGRPLMFSFDVPQYFCVDRNDSSLSCSFYINIQQRRSFVGEFSLFLPSSPCCQFSFTTMASPSFPLFQCCHYTNRYFSYSPVFNKPISWGAYLNRLLSCTLNIA